MRQGIDIYLLEIYLKSLNTIQILSQLSCVTAVLHGDFCASNKHLLTTKWPNWVLLRQIALNIVVSRLVDC